MKVTLILFISFMFLEGCKSTQNTVSKQNMQVVNATFKLWSKPPQPGSEVPERGTDLTVTVQHWPEGYQPGYIVYNKRKSLSASVSDTLDKKVVITARIVRASSMLMETSKQVYLSDRLVFVDPDGNTGFIGIKEWKRAGE